MIHTVFRREFALMPGLVRGVAAGDRERSNVVADHIEFVNSMLYHHHHSEDKHLWPKLLHRGSHEVAPIVYMMEVQHANIEMMTRDIALAMGIWRNAATLEIRNVLAGFLDRIVPEITEHMTVEETRILPIAEKHITAFEWDRMLQEGGADVPRESYPLLIGMLMYEGMPELVQGTLSRMPPDVGTVMKELAPRTFASHSQRVHGTATPPRSTG